MKGWKTALALGAAAAAAGAVAGEYFYRFALTQQIDKTAAFNAPHNRPTGAPRGTLAADREWLNAQPHEDWWLTSGDGLQLHARFVIPDIYFRLKGNISHHIFKHIRQ